MVPPFGQHVDWRRSERAYRISRETHGQELPDFKYSPPTKVRWPWKANLPPPPKKSWDV